MNLSISDIEAISGIAPMTGYCNNLIRSSLDAGKEDLKTEEERVKINLENERKRVQPIYSSQGKVIKYDESGRHLDFIV